jgi:hypothetical protein
MKRILLSLLTIGVVMAGTTAATLAFFQGTTTFANQPSVLSTTGDVAYVAVLTTDDGTPTPFTATLDPGETVNRCLWIRNTGGVPARFKVYMQPGGELGDTVLGDALRLSAKVTPDAQRCTSNPPQISGAGAQFNNFAFATLNDVLVRNGGFYTAETTPFKTSTEVPAMAPNEFSVWQFDLTLPNTVDSSVANKSYTFQGEVFAIQEGGPLDPTPAPVVVEQ